VSVLPLLKPYPTLALIFAPDTNALKVVSPPIFTVAECEIEADLLTESGELLGLVAVCEKSCFVEVVLDLYVVTYVPTSGHAKGVIIRSSFPLSALTFVIEETPNIEKNNPVEIKFLIISYFSSYYWYFYTFNNSTLVLIINISSCVS
jgi:hypothetical protein